MRKIEVERIRCEVCEKENRLGVTWFDGEYGNSLCFKCVERAKEDYQEEEEKEKHGETD